MRIFLIVVVASVVCCSHGYAESPTGRCELPDFSKYPSSGHVTLRGTLHFVQTERWPSGSPARSYYEIALADGCFFEISGLPTRELRGYLSREVEVAGEMTSPRNRWLTVVAASIRPLDARTQAQPKT